MDNRDHCNEEDGTYLLGKGNKEKTKWENVREVLGTVQVQSQAQSTLAVLLKARHFQIPKDNPILGDMF